MYGSTCSSCSGERTGSHQYNCKTCTSARARAWRRANPDKARAAVRKYQSSNVVRLKQNRRRSDLKRTYGITIEQYDSLFLAQRGRCAICDTSSPGGPGRKFMVDHQHGTQIVRGLLCCRCNFLLGHARENPEILSAAISYLGGG